MRLLILTHWIVSQPGCRGPVYVVTSPGSALTSPRGGMLLAFQSLPTQEQCQATCHMACVLGMTHSSVQMHLHRQLKTRRALHVSLRMRHNPAAGAP